MSYQILHKSKISQARIGELETAHGKIATPVFMPVGTLGAVKTLAPEELEELGAEIVLGNTYHLYLRPGEKLIKKMGGLHGFTKWDRPILTDSGGFQVFSLGKHLENTNNQNSITKQIPNSKSQIINHKSEIINSKTNLVKIREDGVEFRSHLDGSKHFFTPEKVIDIQQDLGSDIMMVLDVCTEFPATYRRAKETMELTHAWAEISVNYWQKKLKTKNEKLKTIHSTSSLEDTRDRSGQATKNSKPKSETLPLKPLLIGIAQGSTYQDLRVESAEYISNLPFDGIAVGGVSVGEGKKHMYEVMKWTGPNLPKDKPHYIMGIGEPEDIVEAIKNGFDMFDCVLPTRLARHGVVWTKSKQFSIFNFQFSNKLQSPKSQFSKLDLRKSIYRSDKKPIQAGCGCYACLNGFSRAYISHLIKEHEILGYRLATIHNLHFIINLVKGIRTRIIRGEF